MLEEIIIRNPWWKTKQIPEMRLGKIERREFESLKKELYEKKITCLIGPRRSEKTTLMYETMNYLIENKINPENIL